MSFLPIAFISFVIYSSCIGDIQDVIEAKFVGYSAISIYINLCNKGKQGDFTKSSSGAKKEQQFSSPIIKSG